MSSPDRAQMQRLENEMIILQGDKDKHERRSEELSIEIKQQERKIEALTAEVEAKKTEKRSKDADVISLEGEIAHLRRKINSL
ncbi:MAG: hypothetical protein AAB708_01360 [Patescibacteria group bacterium]